MIAISKLRIWGLFFVAFCSAFFFYQSTKIQFSYDFEAFFKEGDEQVDFYYWFRYQFEDEADFIAIAIENQEGVFDSVFLNKVHHLSGVLSKDSNLTQVICPTRAENFIKSPMAWVSAPFIHLDNASLLKQDSVLIASYPDVRNAFFSDDYKALLLNARVKKGLKPATTKALVSRVDALVTSYRFDKAFITGKPVAEQTYIQKTQSELALFTLISFFLIVIFLYTTYRSVWLTVIPLVVIGLAVVWTVGIMAWLDKPMDLLMVLLPTILFVVGMSDVIHFYSKYFEELRAGRSKSAAINHTLRKVGVATFMTSLTTAIGFFSLYFIEIVPIREFGVFSGVGVLVAFLITICLLPPLLQILPKPDLSKKRSSDQTWNRTLPRLFLTVLKERKNIRWGAVGLTLFCLVGLSWIKVDMKLIDDLKKDDPMKVGFDYIDNHFSGSRPFELVLEIQDSGQTFFDPPVANELNNLHAYLKERYPVKSFISPLSLAMTINRGLKGGDPNAYEYPLDERGQKQIKKGVRRIRKEQAYRSIINDSLGIARLSGRIKDMGSLAVEEKNLALKQFIDQHIDSNILKVRLTGGALLIDDNNKDLSKNMLTGLGVALLVIGVLMGLLFRSFRMVFIALIPNMFPLLVLGAVLGFSGIGLKLSTSIVFTIAFGIAVDDTIHFMGRYRVERALGRSELYALKRSFLSTGRALIVTSFILSSGFLSLLLSSYLGTFYTGLFVSISLFVALAADLLLLPVLLMKK